MLGALLRKLLERPTAKNPLMENRTPPPPGSLHNALKMRIDPPTMNLDGTYNNQPAGTSIFKGVRPPLKDPTGIPYFDPYNSGGNFKKYMYPALKYNVDSLPKPLPYAEFKREIR